ncbi:MAG: peptidoglycan-binding protein [Dermatophilaceae bacterium]
MTTRVSRGRPRSVVVGALSAVTALVVAAATAVVPAHAEVATPEPTTTSAPAPTSDPQPTEATPTSPAAGTSDQTSAETTAPTDPPTVTPAPTRPSRPRASDVPQVTMGAQVVLRTGVTSGRVADLQRLLDNNGTRDFFGSSAVGPYSTTFLADTEAAVKAWQSARGLVATGVITTGSPQWRLLERGATASRTSSLGATLSRGTNSPFVRSLQAALHNDSRGSRSAMFTAGIYDTWFGPEVEAALKRWQAASGYAATGTVQVGSPQWDALLRSQSTLGVALRSASQLIPGRGADAVRTLQSFLDRNRLQDYQPYTNGVYDTFFGPSTASGLKQLQSRLGYPADGVIEVGSVEWGHLQSLATVSKTGVAGKYLRYGTVHNDVMIAQRLLDQNRVKDYFISGSVGGYTRNYLSVTVSAMKAWQGDNGYPANGVITVGSIQWGHLLSQQLATPRLDPRCYTNGIVLCASKSLRKTFYVNKGVVIRQLDARFGGLAYSTTGVLRTYNTAEGTFSITRKIRDEVSYTYNNTPMPFAMYFYGGQAFHYSYGFAANGYSGNMGSHGCVNLRDWAGAEWLFNNTPIGTKVVIYP